jgi:hypothetical protein
MSRTNFFLRIILLWRMYLMVRFIDRGNRSDFSWNVINLNLEITKKRLCLGVFMIGKDSFWNTWRVRTIQK